MSDTPLRPDRRTHSDDVLTALLAIKSQMADLDRRIEQIAATVAGLVRWHEEQAQEDFERRSREQREILRAEWDAEQEAKRQRFEAEEKEEHRERRNRLLERLYLLASGVGILASWDLLSSWEHHSLASLQTVVAVVILVLTVVLLLLGVRL